MDANRADADRRRPAAGAASVHSKPTVAGRVRLLPGRERPLRAGNPWLFSQAIAAVEPPGLAAGDLVEVSDAAGLLLGFGHYNPTTTIAVRLFCRSGNPANFAELVEDRLARALAARRALVRDDTDCYRLVNAEADGLAGVIVDRYADVAVVQFLTAGADRMRELVVNALTRLIAPRAVLERSRGAVRREEGLDDRQALLAGEELEEVVVRENGLTLCVAVRRGQKTGYFLDQRENRALFAGLARNARVLDCFCYAGGFTLAALAGGARSVTAVDSSALALSWAQRNLALNAYSAQAATLVRARAERFLAESGESFNLVVLDPPPLARSRSARRSAARLYTELNRLALARLAPYGLLMTFSCSTHVAGDDFVHAVAEAQAQSGRYARLLRRLGPAPDHPVLLGHPEGQYLTGLLLAATD